MMVQVTELVPWPYLADCESESGRSRIAALLVHQAAQAMAGTHPILAMSTHLYQIYRRRHMENCT